MGGNLENHRVVGKKKRLKRQRREIHTKADGGGIKHRQKQIK